MIIKKGDPGYDALYDTWVAQGKPRTMGARGRRYHVHQEEGEPIFTAIGSGIDTHYSDTSVG